MDSQFPWDARGGWMTPDEYAEYERRKKALDEQQQAAAQPAPVTPARSALGEIGTGLARGAVVEAPSQIGKALQYISEEGQPVYNFGKGLLESAEERGKSPGLTLRPEQHGKVVNTLSEAASQLVPSVGLPIAAAIAAPELTVAAAGTSILSAALAQGQDTYDNVLKQTGDVQAAKSAGRINAIIEGAGEAIGQALFGRVLGVAGKALAGRTAEQVVQGQLAPGVLKPFGRAMGEAAIGEPLTEFGQQYGEATTEQAYGVKQDQTPFEQGVHAGEVALGMTALLAPFGLHGHYSNAKAKQERALLLNDGTADKAQRLEAATQIAAELGEVDEQVAANFLTNAKNSINTGQAFDLSADAFRNKAEHLQNIVTQMTPEEQLQTGAHAKVFDAQLDSMVSATELATVRARTEVQNLFTGVAQAAATAAPLPPRFKKGMEPAPLPTVPGMETQLSDTEPTFDIAQAAKDAELTVAGHEPLQREITAQDLEQTVTPKQASFLPGMEPRTEDQVREDIPAAESLGVPNTPAPMVSEQPATTPEVQEAVGNAVQATQPISTDTLEATAPTLRPAQDEAPEHEMDIKAGPATEQEQIQHAAAQQYAEEADNSPSVDDIHSVISDKGLKPEDPAVISLTQKTTGKSHLDDLNPTERMEMYQAIREMPRPLPEKAAQAPQQDEVLRDLEEPAPEPPAEEPKFLPGMEPKPLPEKATLPVKPTGEIVEKVGPTGPVQGKLFLSRNAVDSGKHRPEFVRSLASGLHKIAGGWAQKTNVHVIHDMFEAPQEVQDDYFSKNPDATQGSSAFLHNGEIYILTSAMPENEQSAVTHAVGELWHEGTHLGTNKLYGQRLAAMYDRAARLTKKAVMERARVYGWAPKIEPNADGTFSVGGSGRYRTLPEADLAQTERFFNDRQYDGVRWRAMDEYVAKLAQDPKNHNLPLLKEIVLAIKEFLRPIIKSVTGHEMNLSDEEIIRDFIRPSKRFLETGKRPNKAGYERVLSKYGQPQPKAPVEKAPEKQAWETAFSRGDNPTSDIGHKRESSGRYVGAPAWVGDSPQRLAAMRNNVKKLAQAGVAGRYWYEKSGKAVLNMFGGNRAEARKFIGLLAIYSPQATVPSNTTKALNAYFQWKTGQPIEGNSFEEHDQKARAWLNGGDWEGRKTNNFYLNLMEEIDPGNSEGKSTMDMWMARAFGYSTDKFSDSQYSFAERETKAIADEMGWTPHQVQAAVWTAEKAKKEGEAASYDFSNALADRMAQMSWEATPSTTAAGVPNIAAMPLKDKFSYLQEVRDALTGPNGEDLIADAVGLTAGETSEGYSAWEGKIGAGAQTFIPVPSKGSKGNRAVNPAARSLLDTLAAARGYVLKQDAVVWHTPVYDDAAIRQNGREINFSRPLNDKEMNRLYSALTAKFGTQEIAPGWTPNGVRILNFKEGLSNKEFQSGIDAILDQLPDDFGGGSAQSERYRSDGEYISNDWVKNPNGEGYEAHFKNGTPGQRNLQERLSALQAVVARINDKWSAPERSAEQRQPGVSRLGGEGAAEQAEGWSARPRQADAVTRDVAHFGKPGLSSVDPKFAGTGSGGAERARFAGGANADIANRAYFYVVNPNEKATPEQAVSGRSEYRTKLGNLYDLASDPRGLIPLAEQDANELERSIVAAGFDGYTDTAGPGMHHDYAVVIGDTPVPVQAASKTQYSLGANPKVSISHLMVMQDGNFDTHSIYDTRTLKRYAGPFKTNDEAKEKLAEIRAAAIGDAVALKSDSLDKFGVESNPKKRESNFRRWFRQSKAYHERSYRDMYDNPTVREIMGSAGWYGKAADEHWEGLDQTDQAMFTEDFRRKLGSYASGKEWEAGQPIRWFHGTEKDFKSFRKGRDTFLTQAPEFAEEFAVGRLPEKLMGERVIPAYASVQNPFDFENLDHLKALREKMIENEHDPATVDSYIKKIGDKGDWGFIEDDAVQDAIKSLGHDGYYVHEGMHKNLAVYDPTNVKSAVGNKGLYGRMNPDIAYSRNEAPHSQSWDALLPETGVYDKMTYMLQDKQIDLKRVIEAIRKTGKVIAEKINPYIQETLYHGRVAKQTEDFWNDEMLPLLTDMQLRGIKREDFEKYLVARQAEETNKIIAQRNPGNASLQDGGGGMLTKDAQTYLAGLSASQRRAYEALASKVDSIIEGTRKTIVDGGLETQDTIDGWKQAFPNYIPLFREDNESHQSIGQGFSIFGRFSKSRTGSTNKVVDVLGNIANQRDKAIKQAQKLKISQAIYGLAKENPNPDFWQVDEPPTVTSLINGKSVTHIDPNYRIDPMVVMTKIKNDDGTITEHAVVFNERNPRAKRLAESIKNLDVDDMPDALNSVAKATRWMAAMNTQYNPVFGVINLSRDVQTGLVNLSGTPLRGKQAQVTKLVVPALKGIFADLRAVRKGKHPMSQWAQVYEEFRNEGGQTGYSELFKTGEDRTKKIESELARMNREKTGIGKAETFALTIRDLLSDYNTAMENAVRVAAYKVALENGMSKSSAANLAKNLTVNFNKKGQLGTQLGSVYAFFNANVQGSARLMETLFEPGQKNFKLTPNGKKIVAGGLILGALQQAMLAAAGYDDDEPPEFVRQRGFIIPVGDHYITVPMALGLHVLPNITRMGMALTLNGFKDPMNRMGDLMGMTFDAFNPIGNAGISLQTIAPTVLDPAVAIAENKDWTGKPIAREDYSPLTPEPGFTRTKDTATGLAKLIAEGINYASGGTEHRAGGLSPTPDQIDYLIGQATGGVGRELSKASQTVASLASGEELPTYKIPLVGRLYGSTEGQAPQASRFYENLKRINGHGLEIKGRLQNREPVQDYLQENPEARLAPAADAVERRVSQLRKLKRNLVEAGADRDRIRTVENLITDVMARFNQRVQSVSATAP